MYANTSEERALCVLWIMAQVAGDISILMTYEAISNARVSSSWLFKTVDAKPDENF